MLKEKDKQELDNLVRIAEEQGGFLNLSFLYMTIENKLHFDDAIAYLDRKGVQILQDDVEPDVTAYSSSDDKIRPFDPSKINITMKPLTLDALLKRIQNEEIEFDSSFQRKAGLWSIEQKSRLLESVFLRIPLPAFYFDATDEGNWLIIDGLQRVTTLKEFVVDKTLKLKGLEFFKELEKCGYDELPRAFKRRIDETVINVYLVNPSTPDNVKFNIFKRINTGGLELTPQEIRNALFQGTATKFLQECANLACFVDATSGSIKSDRMLDREFVLRFVSFCYLDLNEYTGNIDDFLNAGMKYLNQLDCNKLERLRERFVYTMEIMKELMGRNAFRKICYDGRRRPINKVIFESWCHVINDLSSESAELLIYKKNIVQKKYTDLCESPHYLYLLKNADKKTVFERIKCIEELVKGVLGAA